LNGVCLCVNVGRETYGYRYQNLTVKDQNFTVEDQDKDQNFNVKEPDKNQNFTVDDRDKDQDFSVEDRNKDRTQKTLSLSIYCVILPPEEDQIINAPCHEQ